MIQTINYKTLGQRMLAGAVIALILIGIFLYGVNDPNQEWGKFWMIRPLVIVPLAGAAGGACSYFITMHFQNGWKKIMACIVSLLVFIIGLWMGTVLGLAGTLWN